LTAKHRATIDLASEPGKDSQKIRAAGDYVEVIDASSKLYRKFGYVAFFVGDNIYVTFPDVRWFSTKMFFPEQLSAADAPQHQLRPAGVWVPLGKFLISLLKMRL
jgi:hypothetical protein